MLLQFTKMNGSGNDFVVIDGRASAPELGVVEIVRLCDRHRGIGADGLIVLVPCTSGRADWAWKFYNSDGSTAEMCGNGARCFAKFVRRVTGNGQPFSFETQAGVVRAEFDGDLAIVSLTRPENLRLGETLALPTGQQQVHSLNTGVPHAVLFVPDADKAMVQELGPLIRRHSHFGPKGTNVNFVQVLGAGSIRVRTFERGVEGETLACGTGVTASALISSHVHKFPSPVRVKVQAGDVLEVSFQASADGFDNVKLKGPAELVFDGNIEV